MQLSKRLFECLADSRPGVGIFVGNCPEAAELLTGGCDLDWVGVDLQHASVSAGGAAHMLRAIQAADPGITPFVRLPDDTVYWTQQSLDIGFLGLIIPLIESADQVRAVVQAAYFPPDGARSAGGSVRASIYEDYFEKINDHLIVLPQIESRDGLENVDEIVAEPGVSGALIGPNDLARAHGWPTGTSAHPPFMDACRRVADACDRHGKHAAILTHGAEAIASAQQAGIRIIGIGSDSTQVRTTVVQALNTEAQGLREASVAGVK